MTASPVAPPRNADSSSNPAERFSLIGRSIVLDPLIHAYRSDIADIALAGRLFAPHYARAMIRRCGGSRSAVRLAPARAAVDIATLLPGDEFAVLDITADWAWGYTRAGHLVGYVEAADLLAQSTKATG